MPREYVSVDALEKELKSLMQRRGVDSWMQTAFDAADIDMLIHEVPEEDVISVDAKEGSTALVRANLPEMCG